MNHRISSRFGVGILTLSVVVTAAAFGVSVVYGAWMQGAWKNMARGPALPSVATNESGESPGGSSQTVVVVLDYADGDPGVLGVKVDDSGVLIAPIPRGASLSTDSLGVSNEVVQNGAMAAVNFLTDLSQAGVDHLVIVDMPCLVKLADVFGGLPVLREKPDIYLKSGEVLAYLVENGHRDERELIVLNSLTHQALSTRYLTSPNMVKQVLEGVSECVTVDEHMTPALLNNAFWAMNWADKNHEILPVPSGRITEEQENRFRLVWHRKG